MKKRYEVPKAEKVEFDYNDVVVASGYTCDSGYTVDFSQKEPSGCNSVASEPYNNYSQNA